MKLLVTFEFNDYYKIFQIMDEEKWKSIKNKLFPDGEPIKLKIFEDTWDYSEEEFNNCIDETYVSDHTSYVILSTLYMLTDQSNVFKQLENISKFGVNEAPEETTGPNLDELGDTVEPEPEETPNEQ